MNNNLLIYYALSFSAVVKAGGYSSAAKKIGISKAQLSRHVSALETMLGVRLLHRTTRTMTLTEQGQQFFSTYSGIEEQCVDAVNVLKNDFYGMHGTVKITAPVDFGIRFLPPMIDEFSKLYPNLNIVLSLSNAMEDLKKNNIDLAIRIANQLEDSDLKARQLKEFRRPICASVKYFKKGKVPRHPNELKHYRCITGVHNDMETIYPQWQFRIHNKWEKYKLESNIQIDSAFAQIELIKSGAGIGRVAEFYIKDELASGEIIELFPKLEKPRAHLYLLYLSTPVLPRKTQVLLEFATAYLKKQHL
jgi:DNA-binding transcriptional LysR family regulator